METKRINQQVSRNPIKFPERYVFQLTAEEFESLKSQDATSNQSLRSHYATLNNEGNDEDAENQEDTILSLRLQNATLNKGGRGQHAKYLPYAFTERGASMLATVIKGEAAAHITVRIMDAFFAMRDYLRANAPMLQRLANLEQNLLQTNNILLTTLDHQQVTDQQLQDLQASQLQLQQQVANVQSVLQGFQQTQPAPLMGIYFDGQTFDAFQLVQQLVRKATSRIVLIDDEVYHFGASIKDLGKRWFGVNLITEHTADELIARL